MNKLESKEIRIFSANLGFTFQSFGSKLSNSESSSASSSKSSSLSDELELERECWDSECLCLRLRHKASYHRPTGSTWISLQAEKFK